MSSTPWGSDPNAPRQDGTTDGSPGTPRGSEPPSYGTYDPGSSPSYPTEPGGSASSYGEYGSGAQSPSYGGDQGNYGDRPYPAYQQQGAYGQQGAYPGYQGGAPQGKPPSRTGPVVALIIGLLMMFGGPIIGFVVGATQSLSGIVDTASDAQMVPNGGAVELPVRHRSAGGEGKQQRQAQPAQQRGHGRVPRRRTRTLRRTSSASATCHSRIP